jgi:hypothetical protein
MKVDRTLVERRKFERKPPRDLEVAHGTGAEGTAYLRLVDISLGGFSVTSTHRFAPGMTRTFEFTSGGVFTLTLEAIAIYAERHDTAGGGTFYACGFAFIAPTDDLRDTIAIVVNGLADGLLPDWPAVSAFEQTTELRS